MAAIIPFVRDPRREPLRAPSGVNDAGLILHMDSLRRVVQDERCRRTLKGVAAAWPARERTVRTLAKFAVTAAVLILLNACAGPMLQRSDRDRICTVRVTEKFETAAFRANPLANPVGGPLGGAGMGAWVGLYGGVGAIITVPLFAAIGAVGGAACGAASLAYPDADANFQAILPEADSHVLARALSAAAAANIPNDARDACAARAREAGDVRAPDTVVEIGTLEIGMGCPFGKQRLWIHTQWRVLDGADGHELGAARTACTYGSPLDFGEWFTDAGRARSEVELALAITGRRMAEQIFASNALAECRNQ